MGKTILFSPVGGTDPISQTNCRDGSMLHICRWFKPDTVYLYMSHEMLQFQEQDDRYRYCINELAKLQGRKINIEEIKRDDLLSVQEFDYFYNDFKECLLSIKNKMDEDDKLLLNISSGTPAMKSGLLVLTTLGEFECTPIQVTTPTRKINEHIHKDYDVETLWEINEDNDSDAENRCLEVKCPTLSVIKQEEIIKQLIRDYDYTAAYTAALQLPKDVTANYIELIEAAVARLQLDDRKASPLAAKYNMEGFPVKSGNIKKYYEYVLSLGIKQKRGENADFVRAISPIILDLFAMILENECKINISKYTFKDRNGIEKWDANKLAGTDIEQTLKAKWADFGYGKPIAGVHLLELIYSNCQGKTDLIDTAQGLRDMEEKVRNLAAHEIVSVTDEVVTKLTGYNSAGIMKLLKKAFRYAGLNIKEEQWNAYDTMNDFIISKIGM